MRSLAVFLAVLVVCGASPAYGEVQIGLRGGWSHARGDLFTGSGDPGSAGIYGVALGCGILERLDLEVAYERYAKEFAFDHGVFESTLFHGRVDYENQAYLLTGKIELPLFLKPFGLYGGGGGSLHQIQVTVEPEDAGLSTIAEQLSEERNEWEWHLVGGLALRLPSTPLLTYAEYRYQDVSGTHGLSYASVYAGLNLVLE